MTNKFKGEQGHWLTKALFADMESPPSSKAIYWLYDKKDRRPLLKDIFLELNDPTGLKIAQTALGGWQHLERLLDCPWFKEQWDLWQEELRATIKAKALAKIQEIAEEGSAQSLQAAKYLANGEYIEGMASKRGRPTKEEVKGELKRQVQLIDELDEDYQRMVGTNLKIIKGGRAPTKS